MINFKSINSQLINKTKSLCLQLSGQQITVLRHCTMRRAVLYVPADDTKKIDKALTIKLDCLAFDLENILNEKKDGARSNIHNLLNEGKVTDSDPEWCVRVNAIQTGNVFLSDMNAIMTAKKLPAAMILPDVDSVDLLQWFTEQLWKKLMERPEDDRGPIKLLITTGSARGLMRLREICEKAQDLATMAPIVPSAIIFDSIGLTDSIDGTMTSHGIQFLYARQKTLLLAKAFGLQAIDISNSNALAYEELKNECMEGVCMGFTGKQVLYPVHVPIVQNEFTPTRSKVARARITIKKLSERGKSDMEDFTPDRIPAEDPKLKLAKHTLHVAYTAGKIQE